jgi:hypothetical protein
MSDTLPSPSSPVKAGKRWVKLLAISLILVVVGLGIWLVYRLFNNSNNNANSRSTSTSTGSGTGTASSTTSGHTATSTSSSTGTVTSTNTGTGTSTRTSTATGTGTGTSTGTSSPAGPSFVNIVGVSQGSIEVTWDMTQVNAASYKVFVGSPGSTPTQQVYPQELVAGTYTITGLTLGQLYVVGVQTVFQNASTSSVTVSQSIANAGAFTGPVNITAEADSSTPTTKIDIAWSTVAEANNGYQVLVNLTEPVSANSTYSGIVPPSHTSATVSGLTPGTTYYVSVVGVNGTLGNSYVSDTVTVSTLSSS